AYCHDHGCHRRIVHLYSKAFMSKNTMIPGVSAPVRSRWGGLSTEMDRLLFLSMLFSCLLTAARVVHTEHRHFIFLVWNLFLAYIPYFISTRLTRMQAGRGETRMAAGGTAARMDAGRAGHGLVWWTLALLWLLFIPNSFYIITDL